HPAQLPWPCNLPGCGPDLPTDTSTALLVERTGVPRHERTGRGTSCRVAPGHLLRGLLPDASTKRGEPRGHRNARGTDRETRLNTRVLQRQEERHRRGG